MILQGFRKWIYRFLRKIGGFSANEPKVGLTIVDVGRKQTYPVDEFGENAFQTRKIEKLAPGEEIIVNIPVKVQYVGSFRFTGSVIDYNSNKVFTGTALVVHMDAVSNLNKGLITMISIIVPIGILGIILLLKLKMSKRK